MTGNGMSNLPDAQELRLLIREVLRDALAAGYLKAPPSSTSAASGPPAKPPSGASHTSPQQPRVLPAAPPSDIPGGAIQQTGLPAGGSGVAGPAASRAAESQASVGGSTPRSASTAGTRSVRLATDEDLHNFVLTVVRLADNPARRRDLLTGRLRFTLAGSPGGPADGSQQGQQAFRIETGAVTERAVQAAAKAGERLVLGRRAVLTPLARDRALSLGVPIERER
jgi:hypothetical protein